MHMIWMKGEMPLATLHLTMLSRTDFLTCKTQFMVSCLWLMVNSTGQATIYEGTLPVYWS